MDRKYNLKLDLQFRCNNSTMKFNQFDNNTSDFFIKISSGGKSFDVEKAIVVLAIIKPSGKVASQFVEVENGLVYADLKPNMRDEIGTYTAQAMLILEDERVVTDVISYEVEEDKIFSLLNDTVETTEEFTLLTDMLSKLSTIEISEEQRIINEAERILSEENRKIEEAKRVEAELIRQHEEADRSKYDATRESNENTRKQNESIRSVNETNRIDEEAKRVDEENKRKLAEEERNANYNFMTEDEERRRTEANAHKEAEVLRVQAETNRVNEEAKRRITEQARVSAENTRVNNENTREANETTRQTNETKRVEAETQRQNRYNSFIADAEANANNFENYTNTAKVNEGERKSNELDRKSQEARRVSNEVERISNENTRKANEVTRIESEKQRVDAENLRKEKIIEIQSDYDSLKKVIIDENASANLQNQINQTNSQLEHIVNHLNNSNVDINKYGIISVDFNHHPPYSVEEYEIAYNNMEGFKKALEDMSNAGINHVTFPKGYYPMCYRCNSSGEPHFSHSMEWCIRIPSNMIVDLNGSTIKVIYDSENKNQYDKSDYEPSKLVGALFKFDKTYYSTIKNGNLLGDRYDRAYSDATKELDRRVEQTYGIFVTNGSRYCKVENMKISGFMGDAIQSNGNNNSDLGKINNKTTFFPGYIDSEGNYLTDKDDRYTTDFMECIDLKTNEVVLRTNIGYTYVPNFKNQKFEVTFYDDSKKLIGRKTSEHLYSIILTEGTKFIRLTLFNEDAGQISISKTFQITTTPSTNFEVTNTEIYDCNRGGMSNLPLDTVVRNCNLYNNGVSNNPKWLDFPDSTRYAINCEDTVARNFTLENSYIHNCFNTILLSAKKAIINNNTFENCSLQVVGLYNGKDCIISNNQLTNCGGIVSLTDKQNKTVIIKNNLCTKVGNIVGSIHHHSIIVDSNVFVDFLGLSLNSGNIRYSNNTFTSTSQHNNNRYTYNLGGKILNCEIDILHEPYSTCIAVLDMDKFSQNNIININGSNRCKLYNVYNSVINSNGVLDDSPTKCINVVNSSILNMPSFLIAFYGASQEELITYNFKDSNIYNCSTFRIQSNGSHNDSKKVNTHLIFENCTVELSSITSNCVFDIGISLLNEQQNVKITLKNSKFINKSSIDNIKLFKNAYPERITINIENCVFENIINNS